MFVGDRSLSGDPHARMKIRGFSRFLLAVVVCLGLATTSLLLRQQRITLEDERLWVLEVEEYREIVGNSRFGAHVRAIQAHAETRHGNETVVESKLPCKPSNIAASKEQIEEANDQEEGELSLDDIFISVKTSGYFHSTRLETVLRTWWNYARNQTYIFTDMDDRHLFDVAGDHIVNTKCGNTHRRADLCCKMGFEYDAFMDSGKKWWCHFDDDNYVNVNALVQVLRNYNWKSEKYIGKPSVDHAVEAMYRRQEPVKFWFLTGGAGVCISKTLGRSMEPWCRHGKLEQTCDDLHLPDDCTIGFIINNRLHVDVTTRDDFNSHLQPLYLIPTGQLFSQVTLSYFLHDQDVSTNLIRLDKKSLLFNISEDPTRLLSYHCLLYPETEWCMKAKVVV